MEKFWWSPPSQSALFLFLDFRSNWSRSEGTSLPLLHVNVPPSLVWTTTAHVLMLHLINEDMNHDSAA